MPAQRLSAPERKAEIERAASRVFAERGYHGASLGEIAREAGITKPVIYDHFASKRDLHVSLLDGQAEALLANTAAHLVGDTAEERLRNAVAGFIDYVMEHPFPWRMLFRETTGDDEVAEAYQRREAYVTSQIAAWLANEPDIVPGRGPDEREALMLAEMYKAGINGLALWGLENRDVPRRELVDAAMALFWRGLRARVLEPG